MAERAGLLNRCTDLNLYRGFESLPLRQFESMPPWGHFSLGERGMLAFQSEHNEK